MHPRYLGLTLGKALTFRNHLETVSHKTKSHSHHSKAGGINRGFIRSGTLSSTLALCLSVAEHCCPVSEHSTHAKKIDTQLKSAMQMIPRCLKLTPLAWLPVLSYVVPPSARWAEATRKSSKNWRFSLRFTFEMNHQQLRPSKEKETTQNGPPAKHEKPPSKHKLVTTLDWQWPAWRGHHSRSHHWTPGILHTTPQTLVYMQQNLRPKH